MWGENDRVNRGNLIKNMHQKRKNMKRIKKNLQKKNYKKITNLENDNPIENATVEWISFF